MKLSKLQLLKSGRSSLRFKFKPKKIMVLLATVLSVNSVYANPTGGAVTSGSATITNSGNSTVINQTSQQAIINWQSFNINKGQTTQFVQNNSSSVALNRINPSQGASQIYGTLSSNGQVILVNAAGIHFNSSATVNVGGLIASTSGITDANFLAGNYVFDQASSYRGASIINDGRIIAASNGLVALIGSNISNTGFIQAESGSILLGSGSKFTIAFNGDQLINFSVDASVANAKVVNTGSLVADGGAILVSAQTASAVLDNEIDMRGVAQANSVSQQGGEIVLGTNGGVSVSGQVLAKGVASGTTGGTIQISATNQINTVGAVIDASGDAGGGNVSFTANSVNNLASYVLANAYTSGSGGSITYNGMNSNFADSLVSAAGLGTGSFGGNIQVFSNNINASLGSLVTASGDFLGGSVTMSGVPVAGSSSNAANITLDSWSAITADGTGTDSVVGGNINLYANNELLAGLVSAHDNNNTYAVGGDIGIYGQNVYLLPGAYVDASANFVGGVVTLGGNPYSTSSSTASNVVSTGLFSDVSAAVTGNDGFGGVITVSGNTVSLGGELDVSGNSLPTVTYSYSNSSGSGSMCSGGFGGGHVTVTSTINNSGSSGGEILVSGNNITVQSGGYLNASGNDLGGEISLGSNPSGPLTTASISVNAGSLMDASSYGTTGSPIGGLIQLYATNTSVNGTLNASGAANSGSLAGEIEIFAQNTVNIGSFAKILANGAADGGEILIGGDLHGEGFDPEAQNTNVAWGSNIQASALTNGIGGEVVIWSSNNTSFAGSIVARGGQSGGNGGEVDIGSSGTLTYAKTAYVDVSAPHGTAGTVTLEPTPTPAPTPAPAPSKNILSLSLNLLLSFFI